MCAKNITTVFFFFLSNFFYATVIDISGRCVHIRKKIQLNTVKFWNKYVNNNNNNINKKALKPKILKYIEWWKRKQCAVLRVIWQKGVLLDHMVLRSEQIRSEKEVMKFFFWFEEERLELVWMNLVRVNLIWNWNRYKTF